MQNLNEVMPAKHEIKKDGQTVIKTNDIDMANQKWNPTPDSQWQWIRNGEVVKESQKSNE